MVAGCWWLLGRNVLFCGAVRICLLTSSEPKKAFISSPKGGLLSSFQVGNSTTIVQEIGYLEWE
jgi:hypothetical protein